MKNLIKMATVLALVLSSGSVFAKKAKKASKGSEKYSRNYGMAGCGLGSMVIHKNGNQISAGTTNGTSYNQSFAITMGTSNCTDGPMDEVAWNMDKFININKVSLASDIAKGNGETISVIAKIMGCADATTLGKTLQTNFSVIYPNAKVTAMDVTDSVITTIVDDASLKATCSNANLM